MLDVLAKIFVVPRWWILMTLGSLKALTFSFSAAMSVTFVFFFCVWKSLSNYWMDSWFSINFQILAVSRWCILMASDPASRRFTQFALSSISIGRIAIRCSKYIHASLGINFNQVNISVCAILWNMTTPAKLMTVPSASAVLAVSFFLINIVGNSQV